MSYDDTKCPCGGKKEPQTMLCQACVDHMAEHHPFELRRWKDPTETWCSQRSAAIRLLSATHRRKSGRELPMTYRI
jgi:hypothetical protein